MMPGVPSLVSRKWLDTRSVIPAKAGIQLTLLWIPACAGKTIVGRKCRIRLRRTDVKLFTRRYTSPQRNADHGSLRTGILAFNLIQCS